MSEICCICGINEQELKQYSIESQSFQLHQAPSNIKILNKWNKFFENSSLIPKQSLVCSLHFTSQDYEHNEKNELKLKDNAIPSIHFERVDFSNDNKNDLDDQNDSINISRDDLQVERFKSTSILNYENLHEICRFCLSLNEDLIDVEEFHEKMFEDLTSCKFSVNDSLSTKICRNCNQVFNSISTFKNQIKENQESLLKILDNQKQIECLKKSKQQEEFLVEKLNSKRISCKKLNSIYFCNTCNYKEIESHKMKVHLYDHKCEIEKQECSFCIQKFDSYEKYKCHVNIKHKTEEKLMEIQGKNEGFILKKSIEHENVYELLIKKFYEKSNSMKCDKCGRNFNKIQSFKSHFKKCNNLPSTVVCDLCGKFYNEKRKMAVHMRNTHIKELKFKCPYEGCSKAFYVTHHLKNHIKVHKGEKPFKCTVEGCSARFSDKYFLNCHLQRHNGEPKYICSNCSSPFFTMRQMKTHELRCKGVYKPLKPYKFRISDPNSTPGVKKKYFYDQNASKYKCKVIDCCDVFRVKNKLKEHLKSVHEIELNRRTTCIVCYMNFNEVDAFHNHCRKEHSSVYQHHCQHQGCNRVFIKFEFLKRHQRHHQDNLQFECTHEGCTMRFASEVALRTHKRHHFSDSLTCTKCGEKSANLKGFKKHLSICMEQNDDEIIEYLEDDDCDDNREDGEFD